jgi:hypothetical protein
MEDSINARRYFPPLRAPKVNLRSARIPTAFQLHCRSMRIMFWDAAVAKSPTRIEPDRALRSRLFPTAAQ